MELHSFADAGRIGHLVRPAVDAKCVRLASICGKKVAWTGIGRERTKARPLLFETQKSRSR